jgi:hypothetical protein
MSIISVVKELAACLVSRCVGVAIAPCSTARERKKERKQVFIFVYFQIA